MELISLTTVESRAPISASAALIVRETLWWKAWIAGDMLLMPLLAGAVAIGNPTLKIGMAVVVAFFNLLMLLRHLTAESSWVLVLEESRLLIKSAVDPIVRRRSTDPFLARVLLLNLSEITSARGVEYEILWPWGGNARRQHLVLGVDLADPVTFEAVSSVLFAQTQGRYPNPWLIGCGAPATFVVSWEPTYTPKLAVYLDAIPVGATVKAAKIDRETLDLRGFSSLPQADLDNALRRLAEIGYVPMCLQLLLLEKKMSRNQAVHCLDRVFGDYTAADWRRWWR